MTAITHDLYRRVGGAVRIPAFPTSGLEFVGNQDANGDVNLYWDQGDMLPRFDHTAIWKFKPHTGIIGYHTLFWHLMNTSDYTWQAANYEFGTHGYPCDGNFDVDGLPTNPTADSGTLQFYEIAGLSAVDKIAKPMNQSIPVDSGGFVTQARQCVSSGGYYWHRYWPNVASPGLYIEAGVLTGDMETPTRPWFTLGSSPWTPTGASNGNWECPDGVVTGLRFFNDGTMSIQDIGSESAFNDNLTVTSAGAASVWYINDNPTIDDVTDKSGNGRHGKWTTARRPTTWTA